MSETTEREHSGRDRGSGPKDIRLTALELAIKSCGADTASRGVYHRAAVYLAFLTGGPCPSEEVGEAHPALRG